MKQSVWKRMAGLFISYFRITAFTLGGGMVMLPLMEEEFVRRRRWLSDREFMDVLALINALPGVIAVNSALIVGRKVAGAPGAAAAFLGAIIPSILIILLLAPLVALIRREPLAGAAFTAVRSAVAALILLLIFRQARKIGAGWKELVFALSALLLIRAARIHPILIIPLAAAAGVLVYGREERRKADTAEILEKPASGAMSRQGQNTNSSKDAPPAPSGKEGQP